VGAAGAIGLGRTRAASAQSPELTLRFASLYPPAHSASRTAIRFAELVATKTGGKVKVDLFHNASLGSEREAAEGVKSGSIDLAYSGLTGFGSYVPEFGVLEMPFLYDTLDQVKSVVDKISPQLEARMASVGLALLGYLYDGPRVTLSTRPLNSMDDFKGLKLRVPQIPLYGQMAQAFGATPTPVALPEVYTALQSGAIDGQDNPLVASKLMKFDEVTTQFVMTSHVLSYDVMVITTKLWDAQNERHQIKDAFNRSVRRQADVPQDPFDAELLNQLAVASASTNAA